MKTLFDDAKIAVEAGEFLSPVYSVIAVPIEKVTANDYNPNSVAPPEMALLETSIWEDGYTQPVVTFYDKERDLYIVVDGFHRYLILKNSERIRERERGLLPVVVIDKDIGNRMASTIRHNRARGSHNIELMSTIVAELVEMGKGDRGVCQHIGMSPDELLRLKQITGLAALFSNREFSKSWDAEDGGTVEETEFEWIRMNRIYHHWKTWECIRTGMYSTVSTIDDDEALNQYAEFLRDIPRFNAAMDRVMTEWPISCEQFLLNHSINRIAWLGQSAMCMDSGLPRIFRGGFRLLLISEQQLADAAAELKLSQWLHARRNNSNQIEMFQ